MAENSIRKSTLLSEFVNSDTTPVASQQFTRNETIRIDRDGLDSPSFTSSFIGKKDKLNFTYAVELFFKLEDAGLPRESLL